MNKITCSTLVAGIALAATMTVGATDSLAATAAPVLSITNAKLADGDMNSHGGAVVAVDGVNQYAAYWTSDGNLKIVRSKDNGNTWSGAYNLNYNVALDPNFGMYSPGFDKVGIAVSSADAANPTQKIVHVVWGITFADENGQVQKVYYSAADASNLAAWSQPVLLNGPLRDLRDPCIAVTKTGKIHIKAEDTTERKLYYITADSYASSFSEPAPIASVADVKIAGDAEIFLDNTNNLHLSYPYCGNDDCTLAGIKYTKLPAGSSDWSAAVTVQTPTTAGSNHTGLAVYDWKNLYIATIQGGNLTFYGTSTGGATTSSWTKKVVFTKNSTTRVLNHVDIAVNASKTITVGALMADTDETYKDAKLYRSTDSGSSWSTATTIKDAGFVSFGVDSLGKIINVYYPNNQYYDGDAVVRYSKEK